MMSASGRIVSAMKAPGAVPLKILHQTIHFSDVLAVLQKTRQRSPLLFRSADWFSSHPLVHRLTCM